MSWFSSAPAAQVGADGTTTLLITPPQGDELRILMSGLKWVAFVNIGESFLSNEDGWWLLGDGTTTTAIWCGCPVVDTVMRGPLSAAVNAVNNLSLWHMDATPKPLRFALSQGGLIQLDPLALDTMRTASKIESVSDVRAIPLLP